MWVSCRPTRFASSSRRYRSYPACATWSWRSRQSSGVDSRLHRSRRMPPHLDVPVTLRDDDFDAFFEVPFRVYDKDSLYVSPLKSDLRRALDPGLNPLFGTDGRGVRRVM